MLPKAWQIGSKDRWNLRWWRLRARYFSVAPLTWMADILEHWNPEKRDAIATRFGHCNISYSLPSIVYSDEHCNANFTHHVVLIPAASLQRAQPSTYSETMPVQNRKPQWMGKSIALSRCTVSLLLACGFPSIMYASQYILKSLRSSVGIWCIYSGYIYVISWPRTMMRNELWPQRLSWIIIILILGPLPIYI